MVIIGMTGPIGHGKTTLATGLESIVPNTVHLESSIIVSEIADDWHKKLKEPIDPYDLTQLNEWIRLLPDILNERLGVRTTFDDLKIHPRSVELHPIEYQKLILHVENLRRNFTLAKQTINSDNKEAYRPLLQWLGGYMVAKVDSGIWYNEIVKRIKLANNAGTQLCLVGGLRFPRDAEILREAGGFVIKVYRPGHLQNDMLDPTERERDNIVPDSTIFSNGTIGDINKIAKIVLEDIKTGQIKKKYQTKAY